MACLWPWAAVILSRTCCGEAPGQTVDLADDEIGVAAIPKHGDQTTFTVEFGLPTGVSQCDEVLALLNAEIADASSTLMTDTAVTEILTTLVTPQDLNSRCIDTTAEGRR